MNSHSLSLHSSSNPPFSAISRRILPIRNAIPARDRVIDFGKYRGKMVGTLPSIYLKWVSNNLRARDFEEWAKLADEVLDDSVYRDRLEWEFAQRLLNGDVSSSKVFEKHGAVSELLEISERFGWDNEDKVGWAKVDLGLLGTSKGGRIPRVSSSAGARPNEDVGLEKLKPNKVENGPVEGRRRERMMRLQMRRNSGVENGERLGINVSDKGNFGNSSKMKLEENQEGFFDKDMGIKKNAFPGREAFFKSVLRSEKGVKNNCNFLD